MLATLAITVAGAQAETLRGRVYIDSNANGRYDRGERVMGGVAVSDGLNVVKTDADGAFTLPGHAKERFVFITTPSGYKTYNAHYRRISAGTTAYEFGLIPYGGGIAKDGSHSFIHTSDTEIHGSIATDEHERWVQDLRDCAANEHVAFIMHTGDICYPSGLANHIKLMNTRNMNVPVFYALGNHDLVKGEYGEQLFEQIYGPVYYSFDAGGTHYVVTPMMGGDYQPSFTPEDVYQWVKNDLAAIPKGKPVIFFGHDLPTYDDDFVIKLKHGEALNLDDYNLKAWLYGHWHVSLIHKHRKAYSICSVAVEEGGIDHTPASFRVMHIDAKGNPRSELRYACINKSLTISSVSHMQAATTANGDVQVSVNAYSTVSPAKTVSARITTPNGAVVKELQLKPLTDFAWGEHTALPTSCRKQILTLTVKATFGNGECAIASKPFEYNAEADSRPAPTTDWTNLLGTPTHHNALLKADTLHSPRLAWVSNIGSNIYMTSPLVYRKAVYAACTDENYQGRACVACFDASTGRQLWKCKVANAIKNTIVADDGKIFAQDVDGNLYAIDASSGRVKWQKKLPMKTILPALIDGIVAKDGIVYAGSGEALCAVEAATGKELWRNTGWRRGEGTTSTLSTDGDILIGSAHWQALYGNDARTGKLLWRADKDGIRHRSSSAVIDGGVIYLASDASLFVIDKQNGNVLSRKQLPFSVNVASTPLVTDSEIIFGTMADGVVALHRETMDEKWRFRPEKAMIYTAPYSKAPAATVEASPVLNGDRVIVGASDGTLYMLDRKTGKVAWKHDAGAPILTAVAVSGNMMYAADYAGNIYGFVGSHTAR